ncbi:MAG: hypothetical protein HY562_11910 [Ignavibacteriales bacterium]|nr:hypothetical protein [Ignavibacteriales bacterium]
MNKALFAGMGMVLLMSTTAFSSPRSPVEGSWTGEFKNGAVTLTIQVRFWTEDGQLKGAIDIPEQGISQAPLDWIILDSTYVHFELVKDNGTSVFEGELRNGRIVGDCLTSANRGSFYLIAATTAI